jgi:hypothetical protein
MKYMIYLLPILFFTINAEISWAESSAETVELDITMEMLDEDAEAASDIVNVIELPVQLMQQEQVRNQIRIRKANEAGQTQQELNAPHAVQREMNTQIGDAQRAVINEINNPANDAQRSANDAMGQKKGQ